MSAAGYAWIIDRDHLEEDGSDESAAGATGPFNAPTDLLERLKTSREAGEKFRMLDDDDILYFSGRILFAENAENADGDDEFGPLQDYGTPNAGAVKIQYRGKTGDWETL